MKSLYGFARFLCVGSFLLLQYGCKAQDSEKKVAIVDVDNAAKKMNASEQYRYDLSKPVTIELPKEIDEISGMDYDAADKSIYAIDDNEGDLFRIKIKGKDADVQHVKFGKGKDYEGISMVSGKVYVLNSPGSITYFSDSDPVKDAKTAASPAKGKNEFEILYKDPAANRLMMLCKDCHEDKKDELSVWAFDLAKNEFSKKPVRKIGIKKIEEISGEKIGRFKPSGANVHPITGDVYIISSINKMMLVTDADYNLKMVYKLHRDNFKQPEGLCFTPDGKLLISNEAAGKGKANILMYEPQ